MRFDLMFPEVTARTLEANLASESLRDRVTVLENQLARLQQILDTLDPFPCDHNITTKPYYGRSGQLSGGLKYYKQVSSSGVHHRLLQHRVVVRWLILHDRIHDQPDGSNTCPVKWRKSDEWGNMMVVHHMDGDGCNNHPGNLVYMPYCFNSTGANQHTKSKGVGK